MLNNSNLNPDKVYQVFLIIFKDSNVFRYLDVLDELGDYKLVCTNSRVNDDIVQSQYVYLNTNKKIDVIVSLLDGVKGDNEEVAIMGMTLDMMESLTDIEARSWCFKNQEQNMRYIIENTQQENLNNFVKVLDELEKELDKIEDKRKGNVE